MYEDNILLADKIISFTWRCSSKVSRDEEGDTRQWRSGMPSFFSSRNRQLNTCFWLL